MSRAELRMQIFIDLIKSTLESKSVCVQASVDASEHKLLRNGVIHSENEEKYE